MALGTGSVTKVGDTYHAFYTGNNPHFYNQGKPREYIRHAISTDGLQSFVKMEKETFTMDQDDGYNRHDFRDPYLFWNEEGQEWWLLITAVKDNRGVVARYRSQDLNHWEKMGAAVRHPRRHHGVPRPVQMGRLLVSCVFHRLDNPLPAG